MLRQASHDAGEVLSMTRDDEASRGKLGRLSRQAVGAGGGVGGFDGLMPNVELHGSRPPEIDRGHPCSHRSASPACVTILFPFRRLMGIYYVNLSTNFDKRP